MIVGIQISSCQNRPKVVLNRNKMEQLMYDIYIAEATIENDMQYFGSPEEKEAYINKVFAAHNVTQSQWDTSLSWYSDRIDLYLRMNDSIEARLQRTKADVDFKLLQFQTQTIDQEPEIYSGSYIPRIYSFNMPGTITNGFRFQLDSTEISSDIKNDLFSFNLNVIGIPPSANSNLTSTLILVYNDTTIYRVEKIDENRNYGTPISKYVNNDSLRQIFGFVHLKDPFINTPNIQLYDMYLGSQ